ncbi:uncharacterized protein LOC133202127 isoform X1 [Saccostrea echinata]|uniref:uncharacterized protein LOC133202127 isoform X1 n=1 Tax=Saccostrea echinata TaxID=191078 RepID=UPI002A82BFF1|nr:uncharacterized protein LOC133202127 isoform X1 [Saccostrea echinata]
MFYNISSGGTSTEMINIDIKWTGLFITEVMAVLWEVFLPYKTEFLVCTASCLSVLTIFVLWTQTDKMGAPDTQWQTNLRFTQPDVRGRSAPTVSSYKPPSKHKRSKRGRKNQQSSARSAEILSPTGNTSSTNIHRNTETIQGIQSTTKKIQHTDCKRQKHCQESIDLEVEKEQPYIQTVRQSYPEISWDNIATALVYLHKFSALVRNAKIVMKALDHIKDLMETPKRKMELHLRHNIPIDYTETELWDIVTFFHRDMKEEEFHWVYQEFRRENGFPPTPTEFYQLFEKSIQTVKMKKIHTKLRNKYEKSQECVENLRKEMEKKQQEISDLKSKLSQLEILVTRSLCKICWQNEISVLYQPCGHAVSCRACCNVVAARLKRKQMCQICASQVKTTKYLFLA